MIKPLTSLRFFFAFFVFLSHTGNYLKNDDGLTYLYTSFFKEGYLGVSFFFILSGFILAYNYQNKFLENKITKKNFYIARLARIYPLHLLTLLLSLPLAHNLLFNANPITVVVVLLSHLTLIQSFFPMEVFYFNLNGPSWSISNEMFFYLLFPFIVKILTGSKKYFFLLFSITIISVSFIFFKNEFQHYVFYINPVFRVVDFLIGIVLYDVFLKIREINITTIRWTIIEILSLIVFATFYFNHNNVEQVFRYSSYYWLPMIFIILTFSLSKGIVSKILSCKFFVLLGEISFAFYLLHQLIFGYAKLSFGEIFIQERSIFFVFIVFLITIILSYVAFTFFEKPINRIIRSKIK